MKPEKEMFDIEEIAKLAAGGENADDDDAGQQGEETSQAGGQRRSGRKGAKSDAPADEAPESTDDEPDTAEPDSDDEADGDEKEEAEKPESDEVPEIEAVDTVADDEFSKLETEYTQATEAIYTEESSKVASELADLDKHERGLNTLVESLRNKTVKDEETGEDVPAGLTADENIKLNKAIHYLDKISTRKAAIRESVSETISKRVADKWIESSCKAHPKLAEYKEELGILLQNGELTKDPVKNLALAKVERAHRTGKAPANQERLQDAKKAAQTEQLKHKQAGAITAGKGSGSSAAKGAATPKAKGGDAVQRHQVEQLEKALRLEF